MILTPNKDEWPRVMPGWPLNDLLSLKPENAWKTPGIAPGSGASQPQPFEITVGHLSIIVCKFLYWDRNQKIKRYSWGVKKMPIIKRANGPREINSLNLDRITLYKKISPHFNVYLWARLRLTCFWAIFPTTI